MPSEIERSMHIGLSLAKKPNDDHSGSASHFAAKRIKGIVGRMIQSSADSQLPI